MRYNSRDNYMLTVDIFYEPFISHEFLKAERKFYVFEFHFDFMRD